MLGPAGQSAALSLLLLFSLATPGWANPVKRSWQDPCNLETAAAAAGGSGIPETKLLDQIISVSDVIRPTLDQLMDKFVSVT